MTTLARAGALAALAVLFACATSAESNPEPAPDVVPGAPDAGAALDAGAEGGGDASVDAGPTCNAGGFCLTALPSTEPLTRVWGRGNEVWAAGDQKILHWDGLEWTIELPLPIGFVSLELQGSAADDIWLVGLQGTVSRVFHRTGLPAVWQPVVDLPSGVALDDVTAVSKSEAWFSSCLALWHWRAAPPMGTPTWEAEFVLPPPPDSGDPDSPPFCRDVENWSAIFALGAGNVWAMGSDPSQRAPMIAQRTNGAWQRVDRTDILPEPSWGATSSPSLFGAVDASGTATLWVGSANAVLGLPFSSAGALEDPFLRATRTTSPAAVGHRRGVVLSRTEAWVLDPVLLWSWDGTKLTASVTSFDGFPSNTLADVWGETGGDLWIVGKRAIGSGVNSRGFAARRKGGAP